VIRLFNCIRDTLMSLSPALANFATNFSAERGKEHYTCIKPVSGDIARFKIGNTETKWRLIVADTTDPVIIGLDLLHL
jgi:hypothetical protein